MNIPKNLQYTRTHEWVEFLEGARVRTGLTDYAQNAMGSLVFVNLPEEGDDITAGESYADVESVKAVSDVNAPVTGIVAAVNEAVLDTPELLNENPYGAWLIEISDVGKTEAFMDADEYEVFCREEE